MAGIEEAFEKFVTRVSDRERSPAEEPLSNYKSYQTTQTIYDDLTKPRYYS